MELWREGGREELPVGMGIFCLGMEVGVGGSVAPG